ncbi:MAG: nucleoside triphosphate pyrophosphohydrolase, partial [Phenylobacterium sp.]|nr:nucleoside triphosphate pyrophosphohydrolase [Phenylobacterium sp.]
PAAGLLADIPAALPGLTRAVKLSKRAAGVGFVWPTTEAVLDKLQEELDEFRAEVASGNRAALREELGDVLFVMANIARDLDIDPEDALREANAKFLRRFRHIEARLAEDGRTPAQSDLAEMDALWNEARARDKASRP